MTQTHYDSLKVSRTAPIEVIKAAYKTLAQKYHPDKNQCNAEAALIMEKINVAYDILSNPLKREEYDTWLKYKENFKNNSFKNDYSSQTEDRKNQKYVNIPDGVKGWSWGAFLLNWIWAIKNRSVIGMLAIIPFAGFIIAIILGFKGREWAWKNNRWESIEEFNYVQRKWSFWAIILYIVIIILGGLAALLIPAYENYTIRHQVITELNGLTLGMRPVEVTLAKGEPSNSSEKPQQSQDGAYFSLNYYFYYPGSYGEESELLLVHFSGEDVKSLIADRICSDSIDRFYVKGISYLKYTKESEIIEKLGQPTGISIYKNGLSKWLSYEPMNVAFELQKDSINQVCISKSNISYVEEYE